ncbi:uncharacterized protein [Anabrus simplex]|uniref:uncharacterized protein n=1 Tax=Anabrus simplex TaxID=316456 RepID=UPI0035A2D2D9
MGKFALVILLAVSSTTLSEVPDTVKIYRIHHEEAFSDQPDQRASAEIHLRTNSLGKIPYFFSKSFTDPLTSNRQLLCRPMDSKCPSERAGNWTYKRIQMEDLSQVVAVESCKINNGGCQIYCQETETQRVCSCPSGYILNSDKKTCRASGTHNYILTDSSGSFKSPNHPNNYENNLSMTWLLVAPVHKYIRLDFDIFNTQWDADFLTVYDGPDTNARLIAKYSGARYQTPLQSQGNIMLVTFTTSPSDVYSGFSIKYRIETQSEVQDEKCQGKSENSRGAIVCSCPNGFALNSDQKTCRASDSRTYIYTGLSGSFNSLYHPNNYDNGITMKWLLVVPEQHRITLEIKSFRTERGYDPLSIHDGPDTSSRRIASYSGTFYSPRIQSTGNKMFIIFTSDGSNTYSGFSITYNAEPVKPMLTLSTNHGLLRSMTFIPEDPLVCVSIIYKMQESNKISVSADLANGGSLSLGNTIAGEGSGWKIGRFIGTLQPEQMGETLSVSVNFSGLDNYLFSIRGCTAFDEDIYLIHDSVQLHQVPEVEVKPYSQTGPQENCYNGGKVISETKECICPAGFTGSHCQESCGPNSFGQDCGGMCSGFEQGCFKMVFCQYDLPCMCGPGFTGRHCDNFCPEGYYGASCRMPCGHCHTGYCNIYTGECDSGCRPGYYPPLCQEKYITLSQAPVVTSINPNSAVFKANISSVSGRGSVKFCQLQYKEKSSHTWLELPPQEPVDDLFSITVKNLTAGTRYVARVILIAEDGNSNLDNDVPVVEFRTSCIVPASKAYNLVAEKITSATLQASWQYDILDFTWCPVVGFEIAFKDRWRTIKQNVTAGRTDYIFHNLLPERTYSLQVKALTEFGPAPLSSALTVTTLNRAPGEVLNLQASAKTPGEMFVSWNKPRFSNGTISRYRVEYECIRLLACSLPCDESSGQIEVSTESVTLTRLHPHAQYRIKVAGLTAALGPYKSILTATLHTGASVAPGASETPIIHRTNTSIAVQWTPPVNCTWLNGYLYGYRYELVSKAASSHILLTGSTSDTRFNFTNLLPHTLYEVRIFVVTSAGSSTSYKLVIPAATSASAPGQVQNLTVYKKGRRMIGVRWAEPLHSEGPIKSFIVKHRAKGRPSNTEIVEVVRPDHCTAWPKLYCHTINRLTPDSEYIVSVETRIIDIDNSGFTSTVTAVTREEAPGIPTSLQILKRTHNSVVVEWGPPLMINGMLRSFLVNVEEIDTSDSSTCCDYFPIQELPVRTEEQLYRLEVDGLNPASTLTVSVSAKTVTMGQAASTVTRTYPEPPAEVHQPLIHSRTGDDDLFSVTITPSETSPGIQSTYLLVILPSDIRPDPVIWDKELLIQMKKAVNASFYPVAEFSSETLTLEERVSLGTGAPKKNGSLGVLEDPVLSHGSYSAGLILILDYFGLKSVGFAQSDFFVVPE